MLGELVEAVTDDGCCDDNTLVVVVASVEELEEETFAEVSGADAWWVHLLDVLEDVFDFGVGDLDIEGEADVVSNILYATAEVAVLVDISDDIKSYLPFLFGEVLEADLFFEVFVEAGSLGVWDAFALIVVGVVVSLKFVGRDILVEEVALDSFVLWLFVLCGVDLRVDRVLVGGLVYRVVYFEDRVDLHFLLDTLLEAHGWDFQEFNQLDLHRRKLLLKLQL